jgi:hypothetical protein
LAYTPAANFEKEAEMTRVTDHARAASDLGSARKILFELQVEQHEHDEKYHREIARLSVHQRLNHMALHFAKYAGKIASSSEPASPLPVYVDALIIAISTANILNAELWDLLEQQDREYPGLLAFGRALAVNSEVDAADHSALVRKTTIAAGRIAAACEKIDHLEEISFRAEIRAGLAQISALSLAYISLQGIDPAHAVRQRLTQVKGRLKLHGRI